MVLLPKIGRPPPNPIGLQLIGDWVWGFKLGIRIVDWGLKIGNWIQVRVCHSQIAIRKLEFMDWGLGSGIMGRNRR